MSRSLRIITTLLLAVGAGPLAVQSQRDQSSPRVRLSINDDWRFTKDDPAGTGASLSYDVRPEMRDERDDRPPDAEPQAAAAVDAPTVAIKPWILPTGNPFIKDRARRHARPGGNRGGDVPYVDPDFDDSAWRRVDLPHDWAIEGPWLTDGPHGGMGRLPSWGVAWYRKKLDMPARDRGRSIFLDVDGAMSYATVWLNGTIVGGWPYGYASWRVDLTPYVAPGGVNQLAIRLDNPPHSSRWYPGGGIYRNVWLTKSDPLHVTRWGTYVRTRNVSSSSATIDLDVTIDNDSGRAQTISVVTRIHPVDGEGRKTGDVVATTEPGEATVEARSSVAVRSSVAISNPRLWGPPPGQRPSRYVAVTTIASRGRSTDVYETFFGIAATSASMRTGASSSTGNTSPSEA